MPQHGGWACPPTMCKQGLKVEKMQNEGYLRRKCAQRLYQMVFVDGVLDIT